MHLRYAKIMLDARLHLGYITFNKDSWNKNLKEKNMLIVLYILGMVTMGLACIYAAAWEKLDFNHYGIKLAILFWPVTIIAVVVVAVIDRIRYGFR